MYLRAKRIKLDVIFKKFTKNYFSSILKEETETIQMLLIFASEELGVWSFISLLDTVV